MGKVLNKYFSSVFTVEKEMMTGELGTVNLDVLNISQYYGRVGPGCP